MNDKVYCKDCVYMITTPQGHRQCTKTIVVTTSSSDPAYEPYTTKLIKIHDYKKQNKNNDCEYYED